MSRPRARAQLKLIWGGLGLLFFAFTVSMGGLNAWQLRNQGVPVAGPPVGSEVVRVLACRRDPTTLLRTFVCTAERRTHRGLVEVEFRSLTELADEVLVDIHPGRRGAVLVPPGMPVSRASWSPTDAAGVIWLVVVVLAPMVVAVINGLRHSRDSRLGPVDPFDALARTWDVDPARLERAEAVAGAIRERVPPGGDWLDFGAGTGLLGLLLLGHADTMVLADASRGMLDAAAAKIAERGLGERVGVQELDPTKAAGAPASRDAVVSLLALHHVDDVGLVVQRLAAMLRPGGHLALADLEAEDGSFHAHGAVRPAHDGIDRAELTGWLTAAGLVDIEFASPCSVHRHGRDYGVFLAVARKPA